MYDLHEKKKKNYHKENLVNVQSMSKFSNFEHFSHHFIELF